LLEGLARRQVRSSPAPEQRKNNQRAGEEKERLELDQAACARTLGTGATDVAVSYLPRAFIQCRKRWLRGSWGAGDKATGAPASGTARLAVQSGGRGPGSPANPQPWKAALGKARFRRASRATSLAARAGPCQDRTSERRPAARRALESLPNASVGDRRSNPAVRGKPPVLNGPACLTSNEGKRTGARSAALLRISSIALSSTARFAASRRYSISSIILRIM